ncbi:MAG: nucleotide sugar dehydrogenase [Haloarculaceae archaeon]
MSERPTTADETTGRNGSFGSLYGADATPERQRDEFRSGNVPVAVYGLGKMGLPIATTLALRCGNVVGVDLDESVVDAINEGACPVAGEPALPETVATAVSNGALRATSDSADAARASVYVVIVPTLLTEDERTDLSALEAAVRDVGANLDPGDAVFVESTVPPGTTENVVRPALAAESGLDPGEFGLAFCPERTSSGRALRDIQYSYPKIVGGVDDESARVAELVYGEVTSNDVLRVDGPTTAECVKLFEGLYRDVNIALANELATLVDEFDVDVRDAIEAANTQPYCDIHDPGAGVGGHCIPYYPHFVIQASEGPLDLLETARAVNTRAESFTARAVERELERAGVDPAGATVALLGVTYRPGIDETRATPAITIARELTAAGADCYAIDPVCTDMSVVDATPLDLVDLPALDPDAVVLITAHPEFEAIPWDRVAPAAAVDGRDALDPAELGCPVYTIGRGRSSPHPGE